MISQALRLSQIGDLHVSVTEYLHGSFFYEKSKQFILVQVLNTVELLAKGELQVPIGAEIRVNPNKLRVTGARMVWPKTEDLPLRREAGKTIVVLPKIEPYTALYLRLGGTAT